MQEEEVQIRDERRGKKMGWGEGDEDVPVAVRRCGCSCSGRLQGGWQDEERDESRVDEGRD